MAMQMKFKSHAPEVKAEFERKCTLALEAIGSKCEGYAKDDCPVDTGRLRNSIAHQVKADEKAVYIGSPVEYAIYVEFRSLNHVVGKAHFLRDALAYHGDEYKNAVETIFKA